MRMVLILLLSLVSGMSTAQLDHRVYRISGEQCIDQKAPRLYLSGDTLIIECDSMYLLNTTRYSFYREIHQSIKLEDSRTCQSLVLAYERSLAEEEESYRSLLENARQTDQVSSETLQNTQDELIDVQKQLRNIDLELTRNQEELKAAEENIARGKRKSNRQKVIFGVGGLAIGIISGIIIAQ
jgi:hypothetical protein